MAVINGLLGAGGTVLVPTFSWDDYLVRPPLALRRLRNAPPDDYVNEPPVTAPIYSPASNLVDKGMGLIPATVLRRPHRVRGNHPLCSFTAVGPLAETLIAEQAPLDMYAPLRALASHRGSVILMGVGLEHCTLLHYAEKLAGRNPFRRWAVHPEGHVIEVETGGCSDGFPNLAPVLAPVTRKVCVGQSEWVVLPAHETLTATAAAIRANPMITHCNRPACGRCRDAVQGGPILE